MAVYISPSSDSVIDGVSGTLPYGITGTLAYGRTMYCPKTTPPSRCSSRRILARSTRLLHRPETPRDTSISHISSPSPRNSKSSRRRNRLLRVTVTLEDVMIRPLLLRAVRDVIVAVAFLLSGQDRAHMFSSWKMGWNSLPASSVTSRRSKDCPNSL